MTVLQMGSNKKMKKKLLIIAIAIVTLTITVPINAISETTVESSNHYVKLAREENEISVTETIKIDVSGNESLSNIEFWIQNQADKIKIKIDDQQLEYDSIGNNIYNCNVSSMNISNETINAVLTYSFDEVTQDLFFNKKIIRPTSKFFIEFEDEEIVTAEDLKQDEFFKFKLYEPAESPLTWYIMIFVILLIILLAVFIIYSYRKQKKTKKRDISGGSEEFLTTKKQLLMTTLKDIEKQHRAKKISDDTYHKLKNHFKQDAVETMKKIEDIKSEIE